MCELAADFELHSGPATKALLDFQLSISHFSDAENIELENPNLQIEQTRDEGSGYLDMKTLLPSIKRMEGHPSFPLIEWKFHEEGTCKPSFNTGILIVNKEKMQTRKEALISSLEQPGQKTMEHLGNYWDVVSRARHCGLRRCGQGRQLLEH
mmetsp:Transcript_12211/g.18732  ORF Transcript_12211/g.18732 Transcript_12211/m.18732 type:complete len:152 (+) Transcript_12211:104-559(+)|eukprot:CAMPEP_0178907348 /NCGR_PEP_ID=MMETSP0786-20121207/7323_1 /TAXON_ID=186022 /ORGANISM="Thalassionema frauenfeldii, Strain CCMP 1798" /LENGTH=151 /DNA_ID=CAMNT_0020579141 /DNA_START=69 /DNA_END=524 /DNA_ORIENTATION=-